jgi:hypothetical protein
MLATPLGCTDWFGPHQSTGQRDLEGSVTGVLQEDDLPGTLVAGSLPPIQPTTQASTETQASESHPLDAPAS